MSLANLLAQASQQTGSSLLSLEKHYFLILTDHGAMQAATQHLKNAEEQAFVINFLNLPHSVAVCFIASILRGALSRVRQ
jgi:hypothetical protein